MKLRTIGAACASVFFVTGYQAVAQDTGLPKVLRIYREEVKQGKDAAHEKAEANFARVAAKYKSPVYYLGCNVVAGPSEAWFFEAHDSFKTIQAYEDLREKNPAMKADISGAESMDGELRVNSTTLVAVLRPDLSYRIDQFSKDLPKSRYFNLTIVRIHPYTDVRFAEIGRQVVAAYDKANIDMPNATYQVVSGGPVGMYLLFQPMTSLEAMDSMRERSAALMQAAGGMDKMMAMYKNTAEVITGMQTMLLQFNPTMSYVGQDIADQDPAFWKPKHVMTSKPAAKPPEKSGAGQ